MTDLQGASAKNKPEIILCFKYILDNQLPLFVKFDNKLTEFNPIFSAF